MRRLTGPASAFSNKAEKPAAAPLHLVYYNVARPHQRLAKAAGQPAAPAMTAGCQIMAGRSAGIAGMLG
jgi:hypothetical protein